MPPAYFALTLVDKHTVLCVAFKVFIGDPGLIRTADLRFRKPNIDAILVSHFVRLMIIHP